MLSVLGPKRWMWEMKCLAVHCGRLPHVSSTRRPSEVREHHKPDREYKDHEDRVGFALGYLRKKA